MEFDSLMLPIVAAISATLFGHILHPLSRVPLSTTLGMNACLHCSKCVQYLLIRHNLFLQYIQNLHSVNSPCMISTVTGRTSRTQFPLESIA